MPVPHSEWKWYGYPCHLIVGSKCVYHLGTRIGPFLVSTVGDYRPDRTNAKETIGAGSKDFFETFVFRCLGEDEDGNPTVQSWGAIDGERYATSLEAERGHYRFCEKYANLEEQEE